MQTIFKHALDSLSAGSPASLVVVVDAQGSVPGKTGAMVVVTHADAVGTIGGGVAEHRLVEMARAHTGDPVLQRFDHTRDEGSLCSGTQTFAIVSLGGATDTVSHICTTLQRGGFGALGLSEAGVTFSTTEVGADGLVVTDQGWQYCQTLGTVDTLTVIGGGHVSLALSQVMRSLPFRIVVLDNRAELPTMSSNTFAHEVRTVSYEDLARQVPQGEHSYVVIMTYGHREDQTVLEQLIAGRHRYLGMMGSRHKVSQIFANLEAKGVAPARLEQVHAPVGIAIGSQTPAEIAISIAAEIVEVRNHAGSTTA